jgi:dihydroflavonol-4-reductase
MADDHVILVTGATGMVGSVLTRQLVRGGADVRIFRRPSSTMELLGPAAEHVEHAEGDLRDARSVLEAMQGVKQVYHAGAKVQFGARDREALRAVNVEGTAHVMDAAQRAGVDRVVHTSSMAAFGRPLRENGLIDEETPWRDAPHRSDYARSKRAAELEVHRAIAEGLDAVIVNPALIFGTGRPGEGTRRIVDAVRREWIPAVPPGGTNVVDVEDVALGMRRAMMRGESGRRYFLGSENLTWADILRTLADAFGVEPPTRTVPAGLLRAGAYAAEAVGFVTRTDPVFSRSLAHTASHVYRYDNRRAREELGCTFRPFAATTRRIAGRIQDAPVRT